MKKLNYAIFSTVTALVMAFSLPVNAQSQYTDVSPASWYYNSVEYNIANDLLSGTSDTAFLPNSTVSENEFIDILYNKANGVGKQDKAEWAERKHITDNITFDNCLTREEAVSMLYNGLKTYGVAPVGAWAIYLDYSDVDEVSSWATEPLMFCTIENIINGRENGEFAPNDALTRAEGAVVLNRYYDIVQAQCSELETLYSNSVKDASTIEPEEILPVSAITADSPNVTWNEAGDRVLLLTWNKYPDSYKDGENVTTSWGQVWTFTDKDIVKWYSQNNSSITDCDLSLKQLLGLPLGTESTHISALWVKPEDIIRPAYTYDPTISEMSDHFSENADPDFVDWFNSNENYSYVESAFPWTRLGYTYDWADNNTEFGLSEFLVQQNSDVEVAFTLTTDDFITWLSQQN